MFCSKCGSENKDDALFCSRCGAQLMSHEHEQTVAEIQEDSEETSGIKTIELSSVTSKKKNIPLRVFAIVVAIVVLAVVAWIVVINVRYMSTYYVYNEINFNNGGRLAYDRSRLYIVGSYEEDDTDWSLYSTDYSGNNKKLISEDSTISNIRIAGNKIYYVAENDESYYIGSMSKNGNNQITIVTLDSDIDDYDINGDTLYYLTASELHVCTLSGTKDKVIAESVDEFIIYKGTVYYAYDSEEIYAYDIGSESTNKLCEGYDADYLLIYDKELYFVGDSGLYKASLEYSNLVTTVVKDEQFSRYVIYNGCIYYVSEMTTEEISAIAEVAADGDSYLQLLYFIGLVGTGDFYKVDISNGSIEEVDTGLISVPYCYPNGLLCRTSGFSNTLTPVELN